MILRPIPQEDYPRWYGELTSAFPPNECKPLSEMRALVADGRYEILGLYDEGFFVGYATLMVCREHPGYVLLDYLGVTAVRRNEGLGAHILGLLGARYGDKARVITEAELPIAGDDPAENALRLRRIAFYRRCGFCSVYEMATCGARFQALLLGKVPGDLSGLMAAHRDIYGPLRTDVQVPLAPGEPPKAPHWMKEGEALDL